VVPAVAALVVALALGQSKNTARAEARTAVGASNAARARIGLLPRKAPARAMASPYRGGRRSLAGGFAPTFLGEPGTLSGGPELAAAAEGEQRVALSARGVTADVTLSMRFDP
jgi:hypothetical protein